MKNTEQKFMRDYITQLKDNGVTEQNVNIHVMVYATIISTICFN